MSGVLPWELDNFLRHLGQLFDAGFPAAMLLCVWPLPHNFKGNKSRKIYIISRPFSSSLHSIKGNVFSISSRTILNVRMLVSIESLLNQFWNIVIQFRALSLDFVNCNSNSSVAVAEHETAKPVSSIGIHLRQKFHSKSSPTYKGPYNTQRIWMTI